MNAVVLNPDSYRPAVICFVKNKITDTLQLTLARGVRFYEWPAITPQWALPRWPWSPVVTYNENTVNTFLRDGLADILIPDWPWTIRHKGQTSLDVFYSHV